MNNTIGNMNRPNNDNKIKKRENKQAETVKSKIKSNETASNETVSNEARAGLNRGPGIKLKDAEVETILKKVASGINEAAANIDELFNIKPGSVFALLKEN